MGLIKNVTPAKLLIHIFVFPISLVLLGVGTAHGQLELVLLRGEAAPILGSAYKKLGRLPAAGGEISGNAVALGAKFRVAGAGSGNGIFTEDVSNPGTIEALKHQAAPGAQAFKKFYPPCMNVFGETTWQARLSGGGRGVFRSGPLVAMQAADPVAGGVLDQFSRRPTNNDNGDVVVHATLFGAASPEGLFRCPGAVGDCSAAPGSIEALVLIGDAVSDRPGREICDLLPSDGVIHTRVSNYGIAFVADTKFDCADPFELPLRGFFRQAFGGPIETLALQGEATVVAGTTYSGIAGSVSINNVGTVAFNTRSVGVVSDSGIYRCEVGLCPGTFAELIMRDGQSDGMGNVLKRPSHVGITDAGDVAFYNSVWNATGSDGLGVYFFRDADSSFDRGAVRGDLAPLPGGAVGVFKRVYAPGCMSTGGRVAFRAKVKSSGSSEAIYTFE